MCSIAPALADPSDYSRNIAFGDSLQDNGNLYALSFGTSPLSPPYYNGRFSNGPTWIELLSNPAYSSNPAASSMNAFWATGLTTGNVNAAVGGAGTVPGSSLNPVPDVQTQINTFIGFGGKFGPNDLVSVQGGANDFFQFFTLTPPASVPALLPGASVTIANRDASNIGLVIADGAKTVLVSNLPNLGATPSFNGSATTAQAGLLATVTYNTALNADVQALAALNPKVNLIQMDWSAALNVLLAHPSAYGFSNITDPCFNGVTVCSNPNAYLFWDDVHPTEAAQELLARYAALLLSTEETGKAVSALSQVGLSNRLDASDIIFRRGAAPAAEKPGGLYAEVIGSTASFGGVNTPTYGSTAYDYSLAGVRAGFDSSAGPISFGSALGYQTGSLSGHALSADLSTTQIDAYALTRFSGLFAGVEGGVSWSNYDKIVRQTGFPAVSADGATRGIDYSADATIGTQYQLGGITLTPAARVGYASINVDGFTENAPILALQYSDQDVTTGFWTARLRASGNLFGMPDSVAYGEAGYEGLFSTSDAYTAKLAFNTAHAVSLNDNVDARGFFLKTGVGGYVYEGIKVTGEYEVSLQNGAGDIQSGRLRVTIPLHGDLSFKD